MIGAFLPRLMALLQQTQAQAVQAQMTQHAQAMQQMQSTGVPPATPQAMASQPMAPHPSMLGLPPQSNVMPPHS